MTLVIPSEVASLLADHAQKHGTTSEAIAIQILRNELSRASPQVSRPFEPQDEWERRLLAMGIPCGVSLSNEAVGSEGLYD